MSELTETRLRELEQKGESPSVPELLKLIAEVRRLRRLSAPQQAPDGLVSALIAADEAFGDPKPSPSGPFDHDGLSRIADWVKGYKRKLEDDGGGMFDSGMECVTEGGEKFYVDPEEVEEWADALDALDPEFRKTKSKFGDDSPGARVIPTDLDLTLAELRLVRRALTALEAIRAQGIQDDLGQIPAADLLLVHAKVAQSIGAATEFEPGNHSR